MKILMLFLLTVIHVCKCSDPDFEGVFGNNKPAPTSDGDTTGQDLDNIVLNRTKTRDTMINKDGEYCTCVPYHMCGKDKVLDHTKDQVYSGTNLLEIKFRPNGCKFSIELCCTEPRKAVEFKPKPAPRCGYRNPKGLTVEVYGGTGKEAQYGEFPWVVAVQRASDGKYGGVGVIIHERVVLTVAHVALKFPRDDIMIKAGEWDTQTEDEIYKTQDRIVENVIIHDQYGPNSKKNDIAVLHLKEPLQLADYVNALCLPSQNENFDGSKNCVSNGWGKDVFDATGRYAVIMKKVEQDIVESSRCQALLRRNVRLGPRFMLHPSIICAGGEEGIDTCTGDGGAALACPIGGDRYKLTGLVSWGLECGKKDVPAGFVKIPAFRDWIDELMSGWGYGTDSYTV